MTTPMTTDEVRELALNELRRNLPRKSAGTKIDFAALVRATCESAENSGRGPGDHVVLEVFDRLLVEGVLVRGFDRHNVGDGHIALSRLGLEVVENIERDPSNAPGYLRGLASVLASDTIAYAYAEEAVRSLHANCLRAATVLIGAASESLVLDIRNALVERLTQAGKTPTKSNPLNDGSIKRVIDAVETHVRQSSSKVPRALDELLETRWGTLLHHVRLARNEAGHPARLAAPDRDDVRANLILFISIARMVRQVREWIASGYQP